MDCNVITDKFQTLFLGLCYMFLGFLCLCQDFYYPLLQRFHLSLLLLFLCLHSGEFCLQFLHVLHPFDAFCDWHCLLTQKDLLNPLIQCIFPRTFVVNQWRFICKNSRVINFEFTFITRINWLIWLVVPLYLYPIRVIVHGPILRNKKFRTKRRVKSTTRKKHPKFSEY